MEHLPVDNTVPVYVNEGEKAADAIREIGGAAVATGGAKRPCDLEPLKGRHVNLIADRDTAGDTWAQRLVAEMDGIALSIKVMHSAVETEKADAADHIAAGYGLDDFVEVQQPETTAPEGEPIDGAEVLRNVTAWYKRFVVVCDELDLPLLALWTVHTHLAKECYTTPRLLLDSITYGSGKTTVCEHMQRLGCNAVHMATISSTPLLVRILENGIRTLLVDEVDRSLAPDRQGVGDLLSVLNSGYKVGATRPVLVQTKGNNWEVQNMPTHAPVVLAGNSPRLPYDTAHAASASC